MIGLMGQDQDGQDLRMAGLVGVSGWGIVLIRMGWTKGLIGFCGQKYVDRSDVSN